MGSQADIGLIGLAVMGQNLVLNMNDHGFTVVVFNRTVSKVQDFLDGPARGTHVLGASSLAEFVAQLKRPRKIMMMVRAGEAVDELIEELLPLLEPGDVLIDGGNSNFLDTQRRCEGLTARGILYVGAGVSGGEEGARHGPSIMPGGNPAAWPLVKPIFQAIAAKVDGEPCCDWVGSGGAGHYVKMVHNGIEYGDMQLICEAFEILHEGLGQSYDDLAAVFERWNQGVLDSYLIQITAAILRHKEADGRHTLDLILDAAGQKGTGKWTVNNALEEGIPATLIAEAVFARCLSALIDQRRAASEVLQGPAAALYRSLAQTDRSEAVDDVEQALYASKIISYAQGFLLMHQASQTYQWGLNFGAIALMWRGGCIIRSVFLGKIREAYQKQPDLANLLLAPFFERELTQAQKGWRRVASQAAASGIPAPTFYSALAFYDGMRSARLPANLLQAQRDYFGAHTYERTDRPRGQFFHTDWAGTGGKAQAGTYSV
jgi:6-phosphogluconate dehydrogenase